MSFASLGLSEALVGAIEAAGYTQPTPVQQRAIPAVLQGRDLMVGLRQVLVKPAVSPSRSWSGCFPTVTRTNPSVTARANRAYWS